MNSSEYWLAQWIDECGIRNLRDADRALKSDNKVIALRDKVVNIPWEVEALSGNNGNTIVAGRTMDLSGDLACYEPFCLKSDVDSLFGRVWHYFDTIVVVGLSAARANQLLENFGDASRERLLAFVETFLYLRKIGAEDMLVFRQKPSACTLHLEMHANECGIASLLDQRQAWREELQARGKIEQLEQHQEHWHYVVTHPAIEHMALGTVLSTDSEELPIETLVFDDVFNTYAAHLVSDIWAAQALCAPLGSGVSIHNALLSENPQSSPEPNDVLFELTLPFIQGLPARELIKLRQDNWEYFDAFRVGLEEAARERLQIESNGVRLVRLRSEIEQDLIRPELARIDRQLRIARDRLSPKLATSVVVGTAVTTIGLLAHMPLMATTGAAGVGAGLLDYKKYIDDTRDVRTSDMYFLWKAMKEANKGLKG